MREMMGRRCSHCSNNGHNSRTCPNRGVKIFGVRLTDGSIRKSASMGNLTHYAGSTGGASPAADGLLENAGGGAADAGYASEDFAHGNASSSRERKKGVPWTEEEHRLFLLGLKKLGKGDWRGIARNYVVTRTPTQVASHAQKYFIRQTNASRRKRRIILFDMVPDKHVDAQLFSMGAHEPKAQGNNPQPTLVLDEECKLMDSNSNDGKRAVQKPETIHCSYQMFYPVIMPPFYPLPFPVWPGYCTEPLEKRPYEIVEPTLIHPKAPINVDELGGMSKLALGEKQMSYDFFYAAMDAAVAFMGVFLYFSLEHGEQERGLVGNGGEHYPLVKCPTKKGVVVD